MAGAALPGRLNWLAATVSAVRRESAQAVRLVLDVPDWPGHLPGQHLVVRLTAEDGYAAQRSYSIASAAAGRRVDLVVERLETGEVSPYLTGDLRPGDRIEVRGPVGLHFVWRPEDEGPVQLVAGGSGVVPFLAVLQAHRQARSTAPVRLLYSTRSSDTLIGRTDLLGADVRGTDLLGADVSGAAVTVTYTRTLPPDWRGPTGRVTAAMLRARALGPERDPVVYVCGPSGFVETVSTALVDLGHRAESVRTERFGPSGTPTPLSPG